MKPAINGGRARAEHPAIPITLEEQAEDAAAVITAGAGAIHVHVRGSDGHESLAPDDVARALERVRAACPGTLVGISTGAWIVADTRRRLSLIRDWSVLPDFASVNVHEEGAIEVIRDPVDVSSVSAECETSPDARQMTCSFVQIRVDLAKTPEAAAAELEKRLQEVAPQEMGKTCKSQRKDMADVAAKVTAAPDVAARARR